MYMYSSQNEQKRLGNNETFSYSTQWQQEVGEGDSNTMHWVVLESTFQKFMWQCIFVPKLEFKCWDALTAMSKHYNKDDIEYTK